MANKTLSIKLSLNDKQFQSNLKKSTRSLQRFGKKMQQTGDAMVRNFVLPMGALGVTVVKLASDFEETQSKFNTVFKDIREEANTTAKNLADNFGLSSRAALQLLSDTGDLLTGFGFTQQEALALSKQVNELAVDLASFTNFSGGAEGASLALTKALLGERESIKQLGIAITEADLKSFALEQGLVFKELTRVQKATLTYQLALRQSKNAVGDFQRTSEGFANQMRELKGELEDVAIQLGVELLPVAKKVVSGLRDLVKFTGQFTKEQKQGAIELTGYVSAFSLFAAVAGRLIQAFSKVRLFFFTKLLPVLRLVAQVLTNLTPQGRIISGLIVAASYLVTNWKKVTKGFTDLKDSILGVKDAKDELDKSLDFTVQGATPSPSQLQANMMNAIASGALGNKPTPTKPTGRPRTFLQSIGLIETGQVDNLGIPTKLEPIDVEFPKDELESFEEAFFDFSEDFKQAMLNTFNLIGSGIGQISNLFDLQHQKRMTEIDNEKQAEINRINSLNISEESRAQKLVDLDKRIEDEKKRAQKRQAKRAKAIAILEATVNTAAAVVEALPILPLAIAVGALGAAQIATIASTPIPAFAEGGLISGATLGLIGEGPGTSVSNPEVVAPLDKPKNMIGGQSQRVIVEGVISGEDIFLTNERQKVIQGR